MSAGELRERIAFDERELTSDGYGSSKGDWAEQFVRWARLRPKFGGETVLAARLQGLQPFTITVRRDSQTKLIGPSWRARNVDDNTEYAIHGVSNPDEKKRYLELIVTAGAVA